NDWTGTPGTYGSTDGRFYKLDLASGAVQAEAFVPGAVAHSATGVPDMDGGSGNWESPNARILMTTSTGQTFGSEPPIITPLAPFVTPTLQVAWNMQGTAEPTTPALSPDFQTAYIGMIGQVLALDVHTGANVGAVVFPYFYNTTAREVGSVSV